MTFCRERNPSFSCGRSWFANWCRIAWFVYHFMPLLFRVFLFSAFCGGTAPLVYIRCVARWMSAWKFRYSARLAAASRCEIVESSHLPTAQRHAYEMCSPTVFTRACLHVRRYVGPGFYTWHLSGPPHSLVHTPGRLDRHPGLHQTLHACVSSSKHHKFTPWIRPVSRSHPRMFHCPAFLVNINVPIDWERCYTVLPARVSEIHQNTNS